MPGLSEWRRTVKRGIVEPARPTIRNAIQHATGTTPVPHGGLHVPDHVADEHGSFTGQAGQLPGLPGGVGGGFAVVDVVRTGRPEDDVVRVDGAARRGEFRATRRGRQDDLPAPPGQCAQQVACLVQRR
ncbi:hypothetical protein OK006_8199 [Actinobacteria bacterium OK006]|nr:hypothetical protein OK006_8199 [Actinobacteria bacterium OK006]